MNAGGDLLTAVRSALGPSGTTTDLVQAAFRIAWSTIVEPGDAVAGELVAVLGAERALGAVLQAAEQSPGTGVPELAEACAEAGIAGAEDRDAFLRVLRAALERWGPRLGRSEVGDVVAAAAAVGARLLVPGSDGWPERVDDLGPHAPLVLWARAASSEALPSLAVVGSRANTVAGAEAAAEITSAAADAGCAIVSGGEHRLSPRCVLL